MTTKVTVTAASHDVKVRIIDRYKDTETIDERIVERGDPEFVVYATTTRTIEVVDIEQT